MLRIQPTKLVQSKRIMDAKKQLVDLLESVMRYFYGWLAENDEMLGRILYILHIFTFNTIIVLIILSHTIYPVIWFQIFVFLIIFLVWAQHIILRTCICTSLERKLIGETSPISIDIILDLFKIPISRESRMGVTLLMSSTVVFFLGGELVARGAMALREHMELSLWG
jgi:hypothetical protein